MMTWFKLYHDLPSDINFRKFTAQEKWAWVTLLCLASKAKQRGVIVAQDSDIADYCDFTTTQDWLYYRDKLIARGLVEITPAGNLKICNWEERQARKPSDEPEAVKARVSRHRAKKKAAKVTPSNALQGVSNADVTRQIEKEIRSRDQIQKEERKISLVDAYIGDSPESQHTPVGEVDFLEECYVQDEQVGGIASMPILDEPPEEKKRGAPKKRGGKWADFQQVYNDLKPERWSGLEVVNDKRVKVFQELISATGSREQALTVLSNALRFACQDSWCNSKCLSFENLKSNDKIIQFHERWMSLQQHGGTASVGAAQQQLSIKAQVAKTLRELGRNAFLPVEWRNRFRVQLSSELNESQACEYLDFLKREKENALKASTEAS